MNSPQLPLFNVYRMNHFLAWLDFDAERAGESYCVNHIRLRRYFISISCPNAWVEDLASDVLDRARNKFLKGRLIQSPAAGFLKRAARLILFEWRRRENREIAGS